VRTLCGSKVLNVVESCCVGGRKRGRRVCEKRRAEKRDLEPWRYNEKRRAKAAFS
jgi:hypothetical protein